MLLVNISKKYRIYSVRHRKTRTGFDFLLLLIWSKYFQRHFKNSDTVQSSAKYEKAHTKMSDCMWILDPLRSLGFLTWIHPEQWHTFKSTKWFWSLRLPRAPKDYTQISWLKTTQYWSRCHSSWLFLVTYFCPRSVPWSCQWK